MKSPHADDGMTLVELLVAMTVMAIGISALVAGFSSGILAVNRSAKASTAGALADQQMEAYRRLTFASIATDTTATAAAAAVPAPNYYTTDSAYPPGASPAASSPITAACPGSPAVAAYYYCNPSRTAPASNGGSYRIDSYVGWACAIPTSTLGGSVSAPTCSSVGGIANRPVKQVTIVVRDALTLSKTLVRTTSTFDASTG